MLVLSRKSRESVVLGGGGGLPELAKSHGTRGNRRQGKVGF